MSSRIDSKICHFVLLSLLYAVPLNAQVNHGNPHMAVEYQPPILDGGGGSMPEPSSGPTFETGLREIPMGSSASPDIPQSSGRGSIQPQQPSVAPESPNLYNTGDEGIWIHPQEIDGNMDDFKRRVLGKEEVGAGATAAPRAVGNRPQGREDSGQASSGEGRSGAQAPGRSGSEQESGSSDQAAREAGGSGSARGEASNQGHAGGEEDGSRQEANGSQPQNANNNGGTQNSPSIPGFGQNPIVAKPIFEVEQRNIESQIAQRIPACAKQVGWVDQMCGPQSPIMQQARTALERAVANQPTSKSGETTYKAYSAMMEKANEYLLQYQTRCENIKTDCRSQCQSAGQLLSYKQDVCGRGLYTCQQPPSSHLAQVNSLSSQCSNHDSLLAKAGQDMMQLTGSSVVASVSAQKLKGDAGGTDQATAAAEFETSGSNKLASDSGKFDLYSDELQPGTFNRMQPVDPKQQSTNYQNKGGATGPSLGGGGGGSAGYGNAGGGGSAGYGTAAPQVGGVIQGYSGGSRRGGSRVTYGRGGGSDPYGSATRLTRAQYEKLSPAEKALYRKGMQLKDFLPGGSKDPRRLKVAAYQKRDGITGPTGPSIWAKVSNRYRIHQGNLLPP